MAYIFSAQKHGGQDMQLLQEKLLEFPLIEFFPIDISDHSIALGISIPFKAMNEPRFENELQEAMSYFISDGFQVTDLYSGNLVTAGDIPDLVRQISS